MHRNMKTSLPRILFFLSIFMILFLSMSVDEANEIRAFPKTDAVSEKSTQLKTQSHFVKCFSFNALKHGIYAKILVNGNLVKGLYMIDYDYSGNPCKKYPFDGVIKEDIIEIKFRQKNPYEMSLGWGLEGGEKNLRVQLKIIDDRLVHSRAFSSYDREIKKGIESIDFMKEINCKEMLCY
jgi:hypothetical protein